MKHTVFFWLKDDVSAEQKQAFEQGIVALLKNEEIKEASWGTPAATEPRPVIDHSYDYGLNRWLIMTVTKCIQNMMYF